MSASGRRSAGSRPSRRRRRPRRAPRPRGRRRRRRHAPSPEVAARIYAGSRSGAVFPLSETHGAWRVAFRTAGPSTSRRSRGDDRGRPRLARLHDQRHRPAGRRGRATRSARRAADLAARTLRAVSQTIFEDDPLRLLRAVRLEDELGFALDADDGAPRRATHGARHEPAGRADPRRARAPVAAGLRAPRRARPPRAARRSTARRASGRVDTPGSCSSWSSARSSSSAIPSRTSSERFARRSAAQRPDGRVAARHPPLPAGDGALGARPRSPSSARDGPLRRRQARGRPSRPSRSCAARSWARVEPGPEVGRLLDLVAEEQAAGTISTRDEALELVQRERSASAT